MPNARRAMPFGAPATAPQGSHGPAPDRNLPDMAEIGARIARGDHAGALAQLLPALRSGRVEYQLMDCAATCYWHLRDYGTALALMQVIVETWPGRDGAWGKLGSMAMTLGDTRGAEAFFEQALAICPTSANALVALNMIRTFRRDSHRARRLRNLARAPRLTGLDRANVLNALGRIEEAAGNPRSAFHFFARSKALTPGAYDPDAMDRRVDLQRRLFRPAPPEDGPWPRMVFVVGLPRSGTTLVDAILSRHSGTLSIGESPALAIALRAANAEKGHWHWTGTQSRANRAEWRARFLAVAGLDDLPPGTVVVDKMPLDCLDMGFAQCLFPNARFVFMQRHPLDVGLSNYTVNFHESHPFTRRLDWIGHMIRAVYTSLDDYCARLGPALRVQSYRALVEAPEPQIQALLAHAGLGVEPACLSPEAATTAVHTASVLQVREPINTRGLDKWHRYATLLQPLADALGAAWLERWETRDADAAGT